MTTTTIEPEELVVTDSPLVTSQKDELEQRGTYGQILKSSALVGGSSVLNIGIGIIRTKAIALLIGPAGFGMLSIYASIVTLTQTVAGMGVNSSGVRQIAVAAGLNEAGSIARTTIVLRRVSLLLGLIGAGLLIVFAKPISTLTFGNDSHAKQIAALSVATFFSLISAGQSALIQGMRRIASLAKAGVLGAFLGTFIAIPLVYILRDRGIVPALTAVAIMTALTSWWYSRKVAIIAPSMSAELVFKEASALLKLGFAFMSSGLMTMGVAYIIRVTVLRELGVEATGLYQSAWTLGGLYVGFILQAMGADFYPRLTAQAENNVACNRLVNEQAQVGLLLAGPGVIATLTFAPLVIALFYSARFGAAVDILRWICLGTIIQVVTWPMGFIIVAKAKQAIFVGCELAWAVVSLGMAWFCIKNFGLSGVGIAFFGSYIFHGVLIYAVVQRVSNYSWSHENQRTGTIYLLIISTVFLGFYLLPFFAAEVIGCIAVILSGIYSIRALAKLVSAEQIPTSIRRVLGIMGFAPSHAGSS
jgi:antigen flippase